MITQVRLPKSDRKATPALPRAITELDRLVTLVVTTGSGSLDLYVQKLAEHLDVPKLFSDIYQGNAELFNVYFLSQRAVKAASETLKVYESVACSFSLEHLPAQVPEKTVTVTETESALLKT